MKKPFSLALIALCLFLLAVSVADASRGIVAVPIKDKAGNQVGLYKESHALVIGVSDYTEGWSILPGALRDVRLVKTALEENGFHVVTVENPTRREMLNAFDDFINRYGNEPDARLLFYFAGHGHTLKLATGLEMGYIVPADTPNPHTNEPGFRAKAIDMQLMEVYAKRIQAKHALFLFDSCFSGSIFALSRTAPENISFKTSRPVRQFITAGSADETVPDESIFRGQFIAALMGEGDADNDGYVTGVELGEFLQRKVINYSHGSQHPQYGKIRNPLLDKGDFVFPLNLASFIPPTPIVPPPPVPSELPAPKPIPNKGHLQVNVNVPSKVLINGQVAGQASQGNPLNRKSLLLGTATVRVEAKGYVSIERKVIIRENQWTQEAFVLEREQVASLPPPLPKSQSDMMAGMVLIPTGKFLIGKKASYEVKELAAFYMDRYEVTQAEFEKVMDGFNSSAFQRPDHPVENVTFDEAVEFCRKVEKHLPTSAEWEKAARGRTIKWARYYWGNADDSKNIYAWMGKKKTHQPVGKLTQNNYGLYDILGNIAERTKHGGRTSSGSIHGAAYSDSFNKFSDISVVNYLLHDHIRYPNVGFRCAKKNNN